MSGSQGFPTIPRRTFLAAGAATLTSLANSASAQAAASPVRLLVPMYIYPAGQGWADWDLVTKSHQPRDGVSITTIVNPSNGSFQTADGNYASVIRMAASRGVQMLGYIYTKWGARPLKETLTDVGNWLRFYPQISGFFVDEQASGIDKFPYYRSLFDDIKARRSGLQIFGNPGAHCVPEYLTHPTFGRQADVVVTYEGTGDAFATYAHPASYSRFIPERFGAIVHTQPIVRYIAGPANMRSRKISYAFVTNRGRATAYSGIPAYWNELIQRVRESNR